MNNRWRRALLGWRRGPAAGEGSAQAALSVSGWDDQWRMITAFERALVARLLETPFPGRDELAAQAAATSRVRTLDAGGSFELDVPAELPTIQATWQTPVEAEHVVDDFWSQHFLLRVGDDGRIKEVEIIVSTGGPPLVEVPLERLDVWIKGLD